ncbi:MAG: aldo/keto reductase [Candidatus Bathyarchaeia archaeon]
MKYRSFGKLNWKVSALGFGAMRLPIICNDAARINEPEAIKMIRYAIDHGVNYVDTAYPYHGGNSETLVGKALKDGYRENVKLATKMPTWRINSCEDMDKHLEEQLKRLQTDIDFYLLHGLDKERWQKLQALNVIGWAEKKMGEGRFRHLGFSFHDEYDVFKGIIDSYENWTLCQIQYNYVDSETQAGTRGLRYAASKGLAVVVMEPIGGGRLAIKPLKPIQDLWDAPQVRRTQAEWALLWVWNHPEVSTALSGMSTLQQVKENVRTASHSSINKLTGEELSLFDQVALKYKSMGFVGCTGCRYCLPCAEGVNITEIISLYNEFYVKNMNDEVKVKYHDSITSESRAKRCVACGKCQELCPQQLPIPDIIRRAAWIFEQEPPRPKK